MTVAIIDYGSGNLRSAAKALERAAGEAGPDRQILVTADPAQVRRADHVVLPGVGAFGDCRRGLDSRCPHGSLRYALLRLPSILLTVVLLGAIQRHYLPQLVAGFA